MSVADFFDKIYLYSIGFGVFFGAIYLVYFRDAHFWRYLAKSYASEARHPMEQRHLQSATAYGKGVAAKSYKGILTIGLHDNGVMLSVPPPFAFFHKPLFIPFSDIRGWEQLWYLDSRSYELEFSRAPDVKLVMPASQVDWLKQASRGEMQISEDRSPNKDRPNIWYLVTLVHAILGLAVLVFWLMGGFASL